VTLCFRHPPTGEERWAHVRATALRDEWGRVRSVLTLFADVTERKRAEAERALLAAIVASSEDAIIGKTLAGTITSWNAAAARLYGYAAEEAVGRPIGLIVPPDRADELATIMARLARGERIAHHETERVAKDGRRLAVSLTVSPIRDGAGRVVGASAIARDITAHRRAEAALRHSEARFRALIQHASDVIAIADVRGVLRYVSPSVERVLGYPPAALLGAVGPALVHPDDAARARDFFDGVAATPGTTGTQALRLRHANGAWRHVEAVATNLLDAPGVGGIVANVRDVTERVEAYRILERRVAERTRELATLLDIAHTVASTLEPQPLLGLILEQLAVVVPYTGAAIWTVVGEELAVEEYRGPLPAGRAGDRRLPVAHAVAYRETRRLGRPVVAIVDDVRDVALPLRLLERGDDGGPPGQLRERRSVPRSPHSALPVPDYARCLLSVPLVTRERVLGILRLEAGTPGFYTARHAELALGLANQAAVAIENARLYARAQGLAALEERQRLARELHDSVSQALYGIALGAHTAREALEADPRDAREAVEYVLALAEAGLAEMRALIFALRPESLAQEGLVAALGKQVGALRARHGLVVETDLGAEPDLPLETKEVLYRIALEALHNTAKHARARVVGVRLATRAGEVELEVRDDGAGFDPGDAFPGHLGLHSMRERAAAAGGTVAITSAPGRGTRLLARLPCSP
jgi:PAS domain S-box-containing protein